MGWNEVRKPTKIENLVLLVGVGFALILFTLVLLFGKEQTGLSTAENARLAQSTPLASCLRASNITLFLLNGSFEEMHIKEVRESVYTRDFFGESLTHFKVVDGDWNALGLHGVSFAPLYRKPSGMEALWCPACNGSESVAVMMDWAGC